MKKLILVFKTSFILINKPWFGFNRKFSSKKKHTYYEVGFIFTANPAD